MLSPAATRSSTALSVAICNQLDTSPFNRPIKLHEEALVASKEKTDFDVLIVGAGLSGIAAAAHLTMQCPDKSYVIIEQRADMGGTWDLFRYPGIRSDSDMHTLGYRFKPWLHEKSIADGPAIWDYVQETADEYKIRPNIRFKNRVLTADWSSETARWTVTTHDEDSGKKRKFTANFLFMCAGYYDYDKGYRPDFPNEKSFKGQIVHPQHWPEDLDYSGKKVVVIGSGATAVTIVPVMAETATSVTMLQRTPTWMVSRPAQDKLANILRAIMPEKMAYAVTRFKNITMQRFVYRAARKDPAKVGKKLLDMAKKELPSSFDVEKHLVPPYGPWEQRLCLIPDSDMFKALSDGKAQIVTGHIDKFTAKGIKLTSGEELEADIIVTATGLNLVTLGKAELRVDGKPEPLANHVSYKGVMFSDIPNMASIFGYINASWTLKTDIVCDYVCRLLKEMDYQQAKIAVPRLDDPDMPLLPFVDDFSSGYFSRSIDNLPKNGDRHPWRTLQDYQAEKKILTQEPVDDGIMQFRQAGQWSAEEAEAMLEAAE
ncbi:MAG: NAD(P)/FAD-dependent oxidoreductase [Sphingomonadales bacterium]|jgi:monooxygenase|nr:NAD(P)/FAD-dependent oxidoreductase [Sphingomonadales bacterium]MBL0020940.1 NAD(P)/FAD-dependent oxidoreductase [Sphingomonadales bacterium]